MNLKILGSSSKGNCYLLTNGDEILILEAGIDLKEIKKHIDFQINKVVGCLVTHEHMDHAMYIEKFVENGIDVYASKGTLKARNIGHRRTNIIERRKMFNVGGFDIIPFRTKHDCEEPLGFLIRHDDLGTLLFATDTAYLPNKFPGVNNMMIECNYSKKLLYQNVEKEKLYLGQAQRIIKTHFGFENVKKFLEANDLSQTHNIVLLHLSDRNSNAKVFSNEIFDLTHKDTYVASENMIIEMNKDPF